MSEYFFYLIMCIAFCIIIIKLSLKKKFALDFDFNKPQSVHKKHTPRVLGISFIFMLTFILFLFEIDWSGPKKFKNIRDMCSQQNLIFRIDVYNFSHRVTVQDLSRLDCIVWLLLRKTSINYTLVKGP